MKKLIIVIVCLLVFCGLVCAGGFAYYKSNLKAVGDDKKVVFVVSQGETSNTILSNLHKEGLIKNEKVAKIYLKLNKGYNLQAGSYELNSNMDLKEILDIIGSGKAIDNSKKVTFVEGKRIPYFAKVISDNFPYTEEEVMNKLNDQDFIKQLIEKYWFITDDVLNEKLYYPLEGYLFPSTYQIKEDATIEEVIYNLLDTTDSILSKEKEKIEASGWTVHEFLTLASIVELEGASSNDRAGVAGVFMNRLKNNWTLGSDVTTYYAVKKDFKDELLWMDLQTCNPYNTSAISNCAFTGLPVGPICNPGSDSINASINPKDHNYFYFVADKNGKTYFNVDEAGHNKTIADLKNQGLWYEY